VQRRQEGAPRVGIEGLQAMDLAWGLTFLALAVAAVGGDRVLGR